MELDLRAGVQFAASSADDVETASESPRPAATAKSPRSPGGGSAADAMAELDSRVRRYQTMIGLLSRDPPLERLHALVASHFDVQRFCDALQLAIPSIRDLRHAAVKAYVDATKRDELCIDRIRKVHDAVTDEDRSQLIPSALLRSLSPALGSRDSEIAFQRSITAMYEAAAATVVAALAREMHENRHYDGVIGMERILSRLLRDFFRQGMEELNPETKRERAPPAQPRRNVRSVRVHRRERPVQRPATVADILRGNGFTALARDLAKNPDTAGQVNRPIDTQGASTSGVMQDIDVDADIVAEAAASASAAGEPDKPAAEPAKPAPAIHVSATAYSGQGVGHREAIGSPRSPHSPRSPQRSPRSPMDRGGAAGSSTLPRQGSTTSFGSGVSKDERQREQTREALRRMREQQQHSQPQSQSQSQSQSPRDTNAAASSASSRVHVTGSLAGAGTAAGMLQGSNADREQLQQAILEAKPWLEERDLKGLRATQLEARFEIDPQAPMPDAAELAYIRDQVRSKLDSMPRESKTNTQLRDDHRYYGKHGEFLLQRVERASFYARLGLDSNGASVDTAAIRAAYRKTVMLWHPDNMRRGNRVAFASVSTYTDLVTSVFLLVDEAYKTLSDPASRSVYDCSTKRRR